VKKLLPTVRPEHEGLGQPTIMNPALAARHGVLYVHLVVFAIDLDRLREAVEALDDRESLWPFGWEVFLTEVHLDGLLDPTDEAHIDLIEDVVEDLLGYPAGDPPYGAHLAFAIHDAVMRGNLPPAIGDAFKRWKKRPKELVASLDDLFERADVEAADLAEASLEVELEPKLAPPTRDALEALVATYQTDAPATLPEDDASEPD
jgi:hypothetical protein